MATKTKVWYSCGVCGKRITAEQAVYSSHTGSRYCGFDMAACRKRAKRKGAS